ncbi:MAG TPA: filamentous hemagglutinin family protein, partial [Pseudomonadales bacterium]|nr:filamentous hemagglutinin family protein [Pseudomonadales bacterium]
IELKTPKATLLWEGQLIAQHGDSNVGGRILVDAYNFGADTGSALAAFNTQLNQSGFDETRAVRIHNAGDSLVLSGDWNARNVVFSSDTGSLDVQGNFGWQHAAAGKVDISSNGNLTLTGAHLIAAAGSMGHGGLITLTSQHGRLSVDGTSTLEVSGKAADNAATDTGTIRVRAQRDGDTEVAVDSLAGRFNGYKQMVVEGIKTYASNASITINGSRVNADDGSVLSANLDEDNAALVNNTGAIKTRLSSGGNIMADRLLVTPGVAIESDADITVATALDISKWVSSNAIHLPGELILRAGGNVNVQANVTDGFSDSNTLYADQSYRFVITAGADRSAADVRQTQLNSALASETGNLIIGKGATGKARISTGTGDIEINAARNIEFTNNGSSVFTAGRSDGNELSVSKKMWVPTDGGSVSIQAGGDIVNDMNGVDAAGNMYKLHRLGAEWLLQTKAVSSNLPSRVVTEGWYINYTNFEENFGAIGGGDLTIRSAGKMNNISAAVPTVSYVKDGVLNRIGSGNLTMEAQENISSPQVLVGDGVGRIVAHGSITADRPLGNAYAGAITSVMGGSLELVASGDLAFSSSFDPMMMSYDSTVSQAYSYTKNTALHLMALGGEVKVDDVLNANPSNTIAFTFGGKRFIESSTTFLNVWAGQIGVYSLQDKVDFTGAVKVFPSVDSSLNLLAAGDINLNGVTFKASMDGISLAGARLDTSGQAFTDPQNYKPLQYTSTDPLLIYSKTGSIYGNSSELALPKASTLYAAKDIVNLNMSVTHSDVLDVSSVSAGRDIAFRDANGSNVVYVHGPGELDMVAGRNIDLGVSVGVQSDGNLRNSFLPEKGASVLMLAGLGNGSINVSGFMSSINSVDSTKLNTYIAELRNYVDENWKGERSKDADGNELPLTENEAIVRFTQLSQAKQNGFTSSVVAGKDDQNYLTAAQRLVGLTEFLPNSNATSILSNLMQHDSESVAQIAALVRISKVNPDYLQAVSDSEIVSSVFTALNSTAQQEILTTAFSKLGSSTQRNLAFNAYNALPDKNKLALAADDFFYELRQAGRDFHTAGNSAYDRGYRAAQDFFPGVEYKGNLNLDSTDKGDISLNYSKVYTMDGGDITLMTPGGGVDAGRVTAPANIETKKASELGIVAQADGQVHAYVQNNFAVNQSRVFTLQDDDIIMWSSEGNLDAGKGAKTAISVPSPTVSFDSNGNVVLNFGAAISGSGIRAFSTPSTHYLPADVRLAKIADVDLVAPTGEINAGDAGIGSSGNVNFAAAVVVGANNVDVGGVAVGVPVSQVGSLAGSIG